ncbi:hypothetical protein EVAR_10917_1 [Eumeta japonica]|uniref:Uncharacterized protein n=1 Tax=Eumeta variegata TaxID=151549 RepID=A0A4C1U644_EUMVA|nr:hypothetical protein EVAR_10917_1 [Eumeta japonica]
MKQSSGRGRRRRTWNYNSSESQPRSRLSYAKVSCLKEHIKPPRISSPYWRRQALAAPNQRRANAQCLGLQLFELNNKGGCEFIDTSLIEIHPADLPTSLPKILPSYAHMSILVKNTTLFLLGDTGRWKNVHTGERASPPVDLLRTSAADSSREASARSESGRPRKRKVRRCDPK